MVEVGHIHAVLLYPTGTIQQLSWLQPRLLPNFKIEMQYVYIEKKPVESIKVRTKGEGKERRRKDKLVHDAMQKLISLPLFSAASSLGVIK